MSRRLRPVVTLTHLSRESGYDLGTLKEFVKKGLIKSIGHHHDQYILDWFYAERILPLLKVRYYLNCVPRETRRAA